MNPAARAADVQTCRARHAANRESEAAYASAWNKANVEQHRQHNKTYREAHPDRVRAMRSAWIKANPHTVRLIQERYRVRKKAAHGEGFQADEWRAVLAVIWDNRCAYCRSPGPLEIEHVVPLSLGGEHQPHNLVPACKRCNCSKGPKPLSAWRNGRHADVEQLARDIAADLDLILAEVA